MGEIKFRTWTDKTMVDFELFGLDGDYIFGEGQIEDGAPIMQYTGLKDKNGTEIYEGDIINLLPNTIREHVRDNAGIVAKVNWWNAGWWYMTNIGTKGRLEEYCSTILNDEGKNLVEVIGNIYEHSYLLDDENREVV